MPLFKNRSDEYRSLPYTGGASERLRNKRPRRSKRAKSRTTQRGARLACLDTAGDGSEPRQITCLMAT